MLVRGCSVADIVVIEKVSKYKVLSVLVNSNYEIKPKQRYYRKLQVDEFWTYVGRKKNKVWLVYAYDSDTSEIVAFVWGKRNLKTARELRAKLDALGVDFGYVCCDNWDSFLTAFDFDFKQVGKRHTVDIEGNNNRFRQRLRRVFRKTCCFILGESYNENIPPDIVQKLKTFQATLQKVSDKYDEMAEFLALCPDAGFNYEQLESLQRQGTDFISLAKQLQHNQAIKDLAKKMGRNYIAEEKKCQIKIPQASKSEVHGTHRSDDLMRLLPSELANLEDEDLEMLFYAKLLEKNLITYQLSGITNVTQDESYQQPKTKGPVVACLDTSGSMGGEPINKAKALLFAIANILNQEKRLLYVILFGSSGQLKEYRLDGAEDLAGLLHFLEQGFGGGTDFETPLQRSMQIIGSQDTYIKANILMLSDGDCQLSSGFAQKFQSQKQKLDCMVYSVLCNGQRVTDNFSDEVTVL